MAKPTRCTPQPQVDKDREGNQHPIRATDATDWHAGFEMDAATPAYVLPQWMTPIEHPVRRCQPLPQSTMDRGEVAILSVRALLFARKV